MVSKEELLGLDYETYSAVDLFKHGLHRYMKDPTFTPLIGRGVMRSRGQAGGTKVQRLNHVDMPRDEIINITRGMVKDRVICAHNAPFEKAVLDSLGIVLPPSQFIDSAVVARAMGAAGKLEAAAPQLLGHNKIEAGKNLIKLFSVPSKDQVETGNLYFDRDLTNLNPQEWQEFGHYCEMDALLSLEFVEKYVINGDIDDKELANMAATMEMNFTGWHVDLDAVEEMQRRYLENKAKAEERFRRRCMAPDLNLNSLPQLKEWCAVRGIRARSFDEANVQRLITRLKERLTQHGNGGQPLSISKVVLYEEVLALLKTKQILGGSSLKKLQVILDTTGDDGILRDQYLHVGAGQSWRTTGRSVQMQNLKRLAEPADMSTLAEVDADWDNEELAQNLRQVFTSRSPDGFLIVGDFSSVESRGLAWYAQADWKLRAFREGQDLYKVLAAEIYAKNYDDITKVERTTGKVGELSCGYGAGGGAVQSFAEGMGVHFTEGEANELVHNWRGVNPEVVAFWALLDSMLTSVVVNGNGQAYASVGKGCYLYLNECDTPASLLEQHPKARSIELRLEDERNNVIFRRYFHGCYVSGRNICYYKPSQLKTGKLWSDEFTDPKTKQRKKHTIYGGKLAGILTQSLCREIFFDSLRAVMAWAKHVPNVEVIGQFHDEIVLDWVPGNMPLEGAEAALDQFMSMTHLMGFPLAADIKRDYRYTK